MNKLFVASLLACCLGSAAQAVESQWVQRGATGRLVYVPDSGGDRVPDFSDVGYRGKGTQLIPADIPNTVVLSPVSGDDTSSIQAAINQVGAMPMGPNGFRGAVLLEAGHYDIGTQLTIADSGVVLRGVGQTGNDTVLHGRGTGQRPLVRVLGSGSLSTTGSKRNMIDKVVPVGSRSFRVDSTSGLSIGDTVRVERPSNQAWIEAVGMDQPFNGDPAWVPGTMNIRYDRTITRIEGNRVFVDAPLANAFETQFGGGTIQRYTWSGRIENVGIENLRAESDFTSNTDEDHAWEFVSIERAQNVWVRDATAQYFGDSAVVSNPTTKWVTVDGVTSLDPKSLVAGSRRYTFDLSGQLDLVTNSEANSGRHDFVNNSTRPPGPHVFHNSVANNALNDSGPHQRWATGSLFDNITVQGDNINARNRESLGTRHGWSGANMVIWNSTADGFIVQNPPTAQNWLIGSTGPVINDTTYGPQPPGYVDSHGTRVEIDSLYEAQVADAADVTVFHWSGGSDNWSDPEAWLQRLTPGGYRVEMRDYLIGDIDEFVADGAGSVDDAFVDPAWEAFILGTSAHPTTGFDDVSTNKNVAFTIQHQLDPGERVVHGTLALSLLRAGGAVDTDFVRLFDGDANHRLLFSDLGWDTQINTADPFVGVIDLGVFTDELQTGAVNVQVNDDTAVDWAIYTITVARPLAAPLGATVIIDGGGQPLVDMAVGGVNNLFVGGAMSGSLQIASTGTITVADQYSQAITGALLIGISGVNDFGTLTADVVELDGLLAVALEDSFMPLPGQSFEIVAASGELSGIFSGVELPPLLDGLAWQLSYTSASAVLEIVLVGDYNGNGVVDAADYTVWRDTLGSTTNLAADGNGNRVIDPGDYELWKASFGNTAAGFAAAQRLAVPEPSTMLLVGLFLVITRIRRIRSTTNWRIN